jgi:hypothetical protein
MSTNLSIPSWNTSLEYISTFPYLSSTFTVIHGDKVAQYASYLANEILGHRDRDDDRTPPVAIFANQKLNLSTEAVVKSSARAIVTYLALRALSSLSLYINGTVGLGKMALGLTVGLTNEPATAKYKDAQALLESGVFQLAAGIADFCIGQYGLAAAGLALANGLIPEKTKDIINRAFIWKGDIEMSDEASPEQLERHRNNYSWIQIVADKTQRFVLPDAGASRLQAFINPVQAPGM